MRFTEPSAFGVCIVYTDEVQILHVPLDRAPTPVPSSPSRLPHRHPHRRHHRHHLTATLSASTFTTSTLSAFIASIIAAPVARRHAADIVAYRWCDGDQIRGMPILSRAYGSFDLRLHAMLHFRQSVVADLIDEDVTLALRRAAGNKLRGRTLELYQPHTPPSRWSNQTVARSCMFSAAAAARWFGCAMALRRSIAQHVGSPPFLYRPSSLRHHHSNGRAAVLPGGADEARLVTLTAHMDALASPLTIGGVCP